jgi:hypothetical protein
MVRDKFRHTLATVSVPESGKCPAFRLRITDVDGIRRERAELCDNKLIGDERVCGQCFYGHRTPTDLPLYF